MKMYQVVNFQHQTIWVFKTQAEAETRVADLRRQFPDEGFYVVELTIVQSVGEIK